MKRSTCAKYDVIYRPDMYNLQVRKEHLKNEHELKFIFQIMSPVINPVPLSTLPEKTKWSEMRCRICRLNLYNLKTRQKLKI